MDLIETERAIEFIDATDRKTWIKVGAAIKSEFGDEGFVLWDKWSQKADNYEASAIRDSWKSFKTGKISIGSLIYLAKQRGYSLPKSQQTTQQKTQAKQVTRDSKQSEDENKKRALAQKKSQDIWQKSHAVSKHAYLTNKKINHPEVVRSLKQASFTNANLLLVPVRDMKGTIHSLQYINEDGSKRFTKDGAIKGNFSTIGEAKNKDRVIIAEGLATAASLYQATNIPVVIAFNAENMKEVAKKLNRANFAKNYIVACDNDASGTGVNKALEAAKELHNAQIIIPSFSKEDIKKYQKYYPEKLPSDFNDLHLIKGLDAVSQTISQVNRNIESPEIDNQLLSEQEIQSEQETQEENTIELNVPLSKSLEKIEEDVKKVQEIAEKAEEVEEETTEDTTSDSDDSEKQEKKVAIVDLNYVVPSFIQKQYFTNQGKFYDKKMQLRFVDEGTQLKAKEDYDERIIKHMLDVVQAKNWSSIKIGGSNEFKRIVWLEAAQRNMQVEGYKPTKADLALVKHTTQDLNNTIEHTEHNVEDVHEEKLKDNTTTTEEKKERQKQEQEVTAEEKEIESSDSTTDKHESLEKIKERFSAAVEALSKRDQLKAQFFENELLEFVEKLPEEEKDSYLEVFYTNLTECAEKKDFNFSPSSEQHEVVAREVNTSQEVEQTVTL